MYEQTTSFISLHRSFEDPARFEGTEEEKLVKFREVRDQIEKKIQEWIIIPVR